MSDLDDLRKAAQAALDALELSAPDVRHANYAQTWDAIHGLRAALEQPEPYPLPDSMYPGSKDWIASSYAGRVEWLHVMYEAKKRECEMWVNQINAQPWLKPINVQPEQRTEKTCQQCYDEGVRHGTEVERERCARLCDERRERDLSNNRISHAAAADDCARMIRNA